MADQAKEFIADSNDAVRVNLKQPADPSKDVQFHPSNTYSIFGNEEKIFGYKHLQIDLNFAADTLKAGVAIEFGSKIERIGETEADNIEDKLKDFLPTVPFDGAQIPAEPQHPEPFTPPGELAHRYNVNDRQYGIWECNLTDSRAKAIIRHMQIFVHFFIEGGTFIELDDPEWTIERWTVYFLYAIDPHPTEPSQSIYSLAGYSTAYRLFHLDLSQPNTYLLTPPSSQENLNSSNDIRLPSPVQRLQHQLPSRQRISQFIILPPYQRSSHGSHVYSTMLARAIADPTIAELTVEDPNESFDDLRDMNDLLRLRATSVAFRDLRIDVDVKVDGTSLARSHAPLPTDSLLPASLIDSIKTSSRLCERQLQRLVEMQTLHNIPRVHRSTTRITRKDRASDPNDRAFYWWRMLAKQRLTRHNKDTLQQLEVEERVEKLDETLESVIVGYDKVLERCEDKKLISIGVDGTDAAVNGRAPNKTKKRNVVDEDEDEPVINGRPRAKRKKVIEDEDDEEGNGEFFDT